MKSMNVVGGHSVGRISGKPVKKTAPEVNTKVLSIVCNTKYRNWGTRLADVLLEAV